MNGKKTIIHWFRKGQRIHDNPSLVKACDLVRENPNQFVLRPIFILDPAIVQWMIVGPNRFRFLQQSLSQLNERLLSINSRLYVVRGVPKEVIPQLFEEWNVSVLTFESDIEPYAIKRDEHIESVARKAGIQVIKEQSHTIYDPNEVLQRNGGRPITVYQKLISIVSDLPLPEPLDSPVILPDLSKPPKDSKELENENCYDPPSVEEIVLDHKNLGPNKYPGGEIEALSRMEKYISQKKWICNFEKPNTSPNSLEPSTTVLSPYLKFGCLSSRLFHKKLLGVLETNPKHTKPPVSLVGQLMWRELYYAAAVGCPNFDRMVGNPICYQIPWDTNEKYLQAWKSGETGYPFIDAIMRQLRQEGWIHHLARHAVACFLTRGDLYLSWEEGQKVFEEYLLDADWALNAGNWMWLSASCFFYQYFRVYSPIAFGKKTDPEGKYIRKYVPELKNYPNGIIYEPWKASAAAQKSYGCIIGKDYPERIVIHEEISKVNLGRMNAAYKKNKEDKGASNEVKSVQKRKGDNGVKAARKKKKVSASTSTIDKFLK